MTFFAFSSISTPMSESTTMATHKSTMRARQFAASFVAGLGTLASIWPQGAPTRYPYASAMDALRRDGAQIGRDLSRVIERENARLTTKSK